MHTICSHRCRAKTRLSNMHRQSATSPQVPCSRSSTSRKCSASCPAHSTASSTRPLPSRMPSFFLRERCCIRRIMRILRMGSAVLLSGRKTHKRERGGHRGKARRGVARWSKLFQVVLYLIIKYVKRFYVRFLPNRIVCMAAGSERGHCVVPGSLLVSQFVSFNNPMKSIDFISSINFMNFSTKVTFLSIKSTSIHCCCILYLRYYKVLLHPLSFSEMKNLC